MNKKDRATYTGQFFLGEVEGLGFLAATKPEAEHLPVHFCVLGKTEQEATDNAFAAIKFYLEYRFKEERKAKAISVSEEKRVPFKSLEQVFVPKEVIFATAC